MYFKVSRRSMFMIQVLSLSGLKRGCLGNSSEFVVLSFDFQHGRALGLGLGVCVVVFRIYTVWALRWRDCRYCGSNAVFWGFT